MTLLAQPPGSQLPTMGVGGGWWWWRASKIRVNLSGRKEWPEIGIKKKKKKGAGGGGGGEWGDISKNKSMKYDTLQKSRKHVPFFLLRARSVK